MSEQQEIVIVSPHPDDETLGAGGYLLRQKARGHNIHWINITDMTEAFGYDADVIETRSKEIETVKERYGFSSFHNLKYAPSSLDKAPAAEFVSKLSEIVSKLQATELIIPNPSDAHSDHFYTYKACFPLTKAFRYPSIKRVLCMEILSETEFGDGVFEPNYFVDITGHIEKKIEIMNCYKSEVQQHPFPRSEKSIRSLATLRGAVTGVQYAEAFKLLKWIDL